MQLVKAPLEHYPSVMTLLAHQDCSDALTGFLSALPFGLRHSLAVVLLFDVLEKRTSFSTVDHVSRFLSEWIVPLVKDSKDMPENVDPDSWREEQDAVGKFVHLLVSEDDETQYAVR
jgi:vacuolar protein sorting-associated protein 35